ncbi:hypothetical protein [Nonomuraea sp. NPDC003754]
MRRATNANQQLSRGWLIRRYFLDRATVEEIAAEARRDESTIYRALIRHHIEHRGADTSTRGSWGDVLTRDFLEP